METRIPPITAMASGCSICEPAPSAKASGNMPATVARAVIKMGRKRRSTGLDHGFFRPKPACVNLLVGVQQQNPVFRHDADHHDQAHERRQIKRRAGDQQRKEHA